MEELIEELEDDNIFGLKAPAEACHWSEAQIRTFFESDGEQFPAAPPAPTPATVPSPPPRPSKPPAWPPLQPQIAEAARTCGLCEPSFDTVARMMAMCCNNAQFEQLANLAALLLSDLDDPQNNNPAQHQARLDMLLRVLHAVLTNIPEVRDAAAHSLVEHGVARSGHSLVQHVSRMKPQAGVALVLGWGGSAATEMAAHGQMYSAMGLHTICCSMPQPPQLQRAALHKIAVALHAQRDNLVQGGLLIHLCSNMGYFSWFEIFAAWKGLDETLPTFAFEALPPVESTVRAIVYDCCPGFGHSDSMQMFVAGVINEVNVNMGETKMKMSEIEELVGGWDNLVKGLEVTNSAARVAQMEVHDTVAVPRHFVYSKADKVVVSSEVERNIQSMEERFQMEFSTQLGTWSPHMMIGTTENELYCEPIRAFVSEHMQVTTQHDAPLFVQAKRTFTANKA